MNENWPPQLKEKIKQYERGGSPNLLLQIRHMLMGLSAQDRADRLQGSAFSSRGVTWGKENPILKKEKPQGA